MEWGGRPPLSLVVVVGVVEVVARLSLVSAATPAKAKEEVLVTIAAVAVSMGPTGCGL